jgi:RNA polymerase sigma factor (sigma-70 family)
MNEQELIERIQGGSKESFETIVESYYGKVLYHALKRTGKISEAEDIAQNTFISAYMSLNKLEDVSAFAPWLFTVCNNEINGYFRRKYREESMKTCYSKARPIEHSSSTNTAGKLHSALDGLSEILYDTVLLYYYAGLSLEKIALLTKVPPSRVKSRLHEARKQLRKTLTSQLLPNSSEIKSRNKRRSEVMEKIKLIETGAYVIPRMSLEGQRRLINYAIANEQFGTDVVEEMSAVKKGRDFVIECNARLSVKELIYILACTDSSTVERLLDETEGSEPPLALDLRKEINDYLSIDYSIDKIEPCFQVESVESTQEWYKTVLGWKGSVDARDASGKPVFGCMYLDDIDGLTYGSRSSKAFNFQKSANENEQFSVIWVWVTGLDNLRNRILSSGWTQVSEIRTEYWKARTMHVVDPNGFCIMFVENIK